MLHSQLRPARQNQRVVAILMRAAVTAAIQNHRAVKQIAFAFGGLFQTGEEVGQLFGEESVELTEVFRAAFFPGSVSQAMPVAFQTDASREGVGDGGRPGNLANHICGQPGGVGLQGEKHKVVDRLEIFFRPFG